MKETTSKQKEVLDFIKEYQEKHRVMPTLVEIKNNLDISIPNAQQKIDVLIRKGYMERRNIYIIKK